VKTAADVVHVEIREWEVSGVGESVPYPRYAETTDSVRAQIAAIAPALAAGLSRRDLQEAMGPGAARNAVDCALWDLEAKQAGMPVSETLGAGEPPALASAMTVSLDKPEAMGRAAQALATRAPVIKVKVGTQDAEACIRAVRAAAPDAVLIVDPNESWDIALLQRLQPSLAELRVALVEQPLPADDDAALAGLEPLVPLCADESCHTADDLETLRGRYQVVNIKLDKTGGLTGALVLLSEARRQGFGIMSGCMICTSLSVAPAFHIGRFADFVDLDGPLWLKQDRPGGVALRDGWLQPPSRSLWGGACLQAMEHESL